MAAKRTHQWHNISVGLLILLWACGVQAATCAWTGGGDGSSWHDPRNWGCGYVPGATDDVIINLPSSNPVIKFSAASGTRTVRSIVCDEAFELSGGSLTVSGGASELRSAFSLTGGSLTATGTGTTLLVTGATTIHDTTISAQNGAITSLQTATSLSKVNLSANGGGQILLPAAQTYADGAYANYTIQASGVGSKIDLSHLTSFGGSVGSYNVAVTASGGGEVDLAGAITGNTIITVDGAGSRINGSAVTNLTRVNLNAAMGGQILLPAAQTYADGAYANYTIQASGVGSKIDLSHLTSFAGSVGGYNVAVTASGGGEVDLAGAITGNTVLTLSDATSMLNVAAVTSLQDTSVNVSNRGTANFSALTNLTRVNLNTAMGGQLLLPAAQTYADGVYVNYTIQASGVGSKIDLSHLTSFAGSVGGYNVAVTASGGGEVDLAGAITGNTVITVDGTGSIISMVGVTAVSATSLTATNAARIDMGDPTLLSAVVIAIRSGSTIRAGNLWVKEPPTITLAGGSALMVESLQGEKPTTITLSDPNDLLAGNIDLSLGAIITVSNSHNAVLAPRGDFTYAHQDETKLPFGKSYVFINGEGPQELEVGGADVATDIKKLTNDNFGFGQMVVGDPTKPGVVFLVDRVDNGNRAAGKAEALYLFGKVDPNDPKGLRMLDGLRLLGGSTLYMGRLKVYAMRNGAMTDLTTLFKPNEVVIPFDQGHLCLGHADPNDCRNVAAKGMADQVIHTKPNTLYHVWFDVASNAAGGAKQNASLTVSAAGASEQFPIDPPVPGGNVQWQTKTWRFVAKETTTTLVFVGTDAVGKPLSVPIANVIVMSPSSPYPPDCFALKDWSVVRDTGIDPNDKLTNDTDPNLVFVFTKPVWGTDDGIVIHGPVGKVEKLVSGWNSNTIRVIFPTALPKDGKYTVTLKNTILDMLGEFLNGAVNDTVVSFTLDRTPPDVNAPSVLTKDPTPELTGNVNDPNAKVEVTVAGKTYDAVNDGKGRWRLQRGTIQPRLADGTYDVNVVATDRAGNVGKAKGRLTVDTTPPVVSVRSLSTPDPSPELTGEVDDPQATVQVTVMANGQPVTPTCKAVNNRDGTWTLPGGTINPPLDPGIYNVQVTATDRAGNLGVARAPLEIRMP
jgi:hypothetical protein